MCSSDLCARGSGVFSERARAGWGRGVASTRISCRLEARTNSVEGRARADRGAPNLSSLAQAGWRRGSRAAGSRAERAGAARGGAGSLADALPSPRLTASQGAVLHPEPAEGLETRRQAGDRSRIQVPRSTRGPAGSLHCERRRGTARGRDSYTWSAGRHRAGAAGRCASGGWNQGGGRGTARGLAASLGLRAGWEPVPRGGRGRGWPVVGARPFPRGLQVGRGARSLGGARQVTGSLERQRGGGSPVAGRAAWRPEGELAGWCGPRAGRRPRWAEGEWGLIDWRGDDSEESRASERGRARGQRGGHGYVMARTLPGQSGVKGVNNQRVPTAPRRSERQGLT